MPTPPLASNSALFLDVDGTLIEIADRPDAVIVPEWLPDRLARLSDLLDGAMALVSGRPILEIDGLLGTSQLSVAGEHGAQLRIGGGEIERLPTAALTSELDQVKSRFGTQSGILIEEKAAGFAVHTRMVPDWAPEVRAFLETLVQKRSDIELLMGKAVCEIRTQGISKAGAIETLMRRAPFMGRQALFVGDDITDEDGFRAVHAMGGNSIKVGEGQSVAESHLSSVADVHLWLQEGLSGLEPASPELEAGG